MGRACLHRPYGLRFLGAVFCAAAVTASGLVSLTVVQFLAGDADVLRWLPVAVAALLVWRMQSAATARTT